MVVEALFINVTTDDAATYNKMMKKNRTHTLTAIFIKIKHLQSAQ